jgi:hypothetical protein
MVDDYLATQIDRLKREISAGEALAAIDEFLSLASGNRSLYNDVMLQRARYVRVERDERKGLLAYGQAAVEKNRIADALYGLLDELPMKLSPADLPVAPTRPSDESATVLMVKPEKIVGVNNLKQISWVARGLECAHSVCRVLTPSGLGTGFLVSPDLIMTNNHVIPSVEVAGRTRVEFNYQLAFDGSFERACRYALDPDRFCTDVGLDYTLVKVLESSQNPSLKQWGYLPLNPNADPVPSEHVSIIQHPNGGLKQIVMTANQVIGIGNPYLWYTTDTMGGSSGSPVFNDLWQVIALHHAATVSGYNEGVLISHIKPKAEAVGFWPKGQPEK